MADLPTLSFKKGEARENVQFTITQGGSALNLSLATAITLTVKSRVSDATAVFTKSTSDFDTTDAANGIIKVDFSASNLATAGQYVADIKIKFSDTDIRITETFRITIEESVA